MLRLWAEELADGRVEWRGKVQHVSSGETYYFRDWPTLIAHLLELLPNPRHESGTTEPAEPDNSEEKRT